MFDSCIYLVYFGRQDWANSEDPDQLPQEELSDQGFRCLPLIQQFLTNKMDLLKYQDKYGNQLRYPNTLSLPGQIKMIFILFFPENRFSHLMHIVFLEDNLHETTRSVFWGK